jgi:hypothetical protein
LGKYAHRAQAERQDQPQPANARRKMCPSIATEYTIDVLKPHTSGLREPNIDSLLELIQKGDDFEEESKLRLYEVAKTIMVLRGASQSEEWSNLLRGVIVLTTCLGFPKGGVSETCTWLCT